MKEKTEQEAYLQLAAVCAHAEHCEHDGVFSNAFNSVSVFHNPNYYRTNLKLMKILYSVF